IAGLPLLLRWRRRGASKSAAECGWLNTALARLRLKRRLSHARLDILRLATEGLCHRTPQMVVRAHIRQRPMQSAKNEIMDQAAIAETHFVFGRVNIDIHSGRV